MPDNAAHGNQERFRKRRYTKPGRLRTGRGCPLPEAACADAEVVGGGSRLPEGGRRRALPAADPSAAEATFGIVFLEPDRSPCAALAQDRARRTDPGSARGGQVRRTVGENRTATPQQRSMDSRRETVP